MKKNIYKNQTGFSALLTVVIIAAASLIMANSAAILSLGELDMGYYSNKGGGALYLADACIEEALNRIRLDNSYTATDYLLSIDNDSCIINVEISANNRVLTAEGISSNFRKKIEVNIALANGSIVFNSWEIKEN